MCTYMGQKATLIPALFIVNTANNLNIHQQRCEWILYNNQKSMTASRRRYGQILHTQHEWKQPEIKDDRLHDSIYRKFKHRQKKLRYRNESGGGSAEWLKERRGKPLDIGNVLTLSWPVVRWVCSTHPFVGFVKGQVLTIGDRSVLQNVHYTQKE